VRVRSIFRYVGGKSRAVKHILPYLEDAKILYSPFFGGGSVELAFSETGQVIGGDLYEPVAVFWQETLKNPVAVADEVQKYHPLPKARFYELQIELSDLKSPLEMASVFYVLNRASFSGSTNSGGMSPNHPRFNQASIDRLRKFSAPNLEIHHKDAFQFLEELKTIDPEGKAIYLDPPILAVINLIVVANQSTSLTGLFASGIIRFPVLASTIFTRAVFINCIIIKVTHIITVLLVLNHTTHIKMAHCFKWVITLLWASPIFR
jgi:DNA adenine methylase